MGLFSRKSKQNSCVMCGKPGDQGCGHIDEIRPDSPSWLPAPLRGQAIGQYTFCCTRCNSYPEMKWPSSGGANAAMLAHLGAAHHVGPLSGMARQFGMVPIT